MFANVPNVTVSDWFASAEITSRMLRTLNNIGPGGVIIADLYRRDYYATHSCTLNHASQTSFIVYGYHDLAADMADYVEDFGERVWEVLVPAVDRTTWKCMDQRAQDVTGTGCVVTRMRQTMCELGFDLTSAPYYYDRNSTPTLRMVRDLYIYRAQPAITVMVKSPADEKTGGLSLIAISDDDHRVHGWPGHVTGWPARMRTQFTTGPNAHRVREAVEAYLRRTRT